MKRTFNFALILCLLLALNIPVYADEPDCIYVASGKEIFICAETGYDIPASCDNQADTSDHIYVIYSQAVPISYPPDAIAVDVDPVVMKLLEKVNEARAAQDLGTLISDSDLREAAQIRVQEIALKFSHTRPNGQLWNSVSDKVHGENLAMGYRTASSVMEAWLASTGHRRNILHPKFKSTGIACAEIDGLYYWVQLFGME